MDVAYILCIHITTFLNVFLVICFINNNYYTRVKLSASYGYLDI